jgi:L-lactate dehydrogenase complex protein LldF
MAVTTHAFRASARIALADIELRQSFEGATARFASARSRALADLPEAERMRDHFKAIREATLSNLGDHLRKFEDTATAQGTRVHWARDAAEARRIVIELAQQRNARLVVKSKSMATEEIHLNTALEQAGIVAVETDLGEWLIQRAGEPPSHIIAPAIHMTKQRAAELLTAASGRDLRSAEIPALTAEARRLLREQFLAADMGISGGNLLVAETGSLVLVTNEGNGRLVTSAPNVHVAVVGIEKVVPTWDEAAVWLSLLARSATGQPMSIYTSIISGPARRDDVDGPREVHIVLLDNGRSRLVGTVYEEILQCIRCGACLNACPVYGEVGGHAYGSPYSGPIGAVVSPLLFGLEDFEGLPQASSLCGACRDVCPAQIDIPRMLLALRADTVAQKLMPWAERVSERAAASLLESPRRMRLATGAGRILQKPFVLADEIQLPAGLDPTAGRALPKLAATSFRALWGENRLFEDEEAADGST